VRQGPGRRPTEPAAERRGAFGHGHVVGAGTSKNAVSIVTSGAGTWCTGMWRAKTSIYPTCRTPAAQEQPVVDSAEQVAARARVVPTNPGLGTHDLAPINLRQSDPRSAVAAALAARLGVGSTATVALRGGRGRRALAGGHRRAAATAASHGCGGCLVLACRGGHHRVLPLGVTSGAARARGPLCSRDRLRGGGSRTRRPAPPAAAAPALTCGSSGAHSQPVALWPVVRSSSRRS